MKKKFICFSIIFSLFMLLRIDVYAYSYKTEDIPNNSYVIGTHLFTRKDLNDNYDGILKTKHVMLGAKSITSDSLDDMIIYSKDPRGVWRNEITGEIVDMGEEIEIEYRNSLPYLSKPDLVLNSYHYHDDTSQYTFEYNINNSIDTDFDLENYSVYEKINDQYNFIGKYDINTPFVINISINEIKILVVKSSIVDSQGNEIYSDYSDEIEVKAKPVSTPNVVINTETDTYEILSSATNNISKLYYSNDEDISLTISKSSLSVDDNVVKYGYSSTVDGEKTICDINEEIEFVANENQWDDIYIWMIDEDGYSSEYYIKLSFTYSKIILSSDMYEYLEIDNNVTLHGENYFYDKNNNSTYENYTSEQKEMLERYFSSLISSNSTKRSKSVAAAKFLAIQFSTQINYISNEEGVYFQNNLNIHDDETCWNCIDTSSKKHGFQCSGFVIWSLLNGGVNFSDFSPPYTNSLYLSGFFSPLGWVQNFNYENRYPNLNDDNLFVSNSNIIMINNDIPWNSIQIGDLIGVSVYSSARERINGGHVGIIVDLTGEYISIAHAASWGTKVNGSDGVQITRYKKNDLYQSDKWSGGHIILMDEIYNDL